MSNDYLSVDETAIILKVDPESVYRWLRAGIFPGAKFGGIWRIRREDIDAYFQKKGAKDA